jgi:hypothetical protein
LSKSTYCSSAIFLFIYRNKNNHLNKYLFKNYLNLFIVNYPLILPNNIRELKENFKVEGGNARVLKNKIKRNLIIANYALSIIN